MFAAESTPLPWAPPITQLREFVVAFSNVDFFSCPSFNALELAASRRVVQAAFARVFLAAVWADAHARINRVAAVLASHFFGGGACHSR
jgi:hypothetical protein